jgi:hypothetical protein
MDSSLLQKFRRQLATWVEARLESQRLPFQRLEICPGILTIRGRLVPDLVLWINRDSQLAGSIILLPITIDEQVLVEGAALAEALGLGHFTIWAAREVSIWKPSPKGPTKLESYPLPAANHITPEDFQNTLDDLLDQLKIVAITSAPDIRAYSAYYFANLCLRNLQELTPGLTISARVTAGQTTTDEWVEEAPRIKAWLSLWRILFLLWRGRLPQALQPERVEAAISYALADLTAGQLSWLEPQQDEPPLSEGDAVRLYHLAGRLKQLGWPQSNCAAADLVWMLLQESVHRLGLEPVCLPWSTDEAKLRIACPPVQADTYCALVAPRAYLAGWALKSAILDQVNDISCGENLSDLDKGKEWPGAVAIFNTAGPLNRKEHSAHLIRLRHAWPNRRFDLPRDTPAWLWEALYLAGITSDDLTLILPDNWPHAAGVMALWQVLTERFYLAEMKEHDKGSQALHFLQHKHDLESPCRVHRKEQSIEVPHALHVVQMPGTTQVWLKANEQLVSLLIEKKMGAFGRLLTDEPEQLAQGLHLYLQTSLGSYLWGLSGGQTPLPETGVAPQTVITLGVPVPDEMTLMDLAATGLSMTGTAPDVTVLDREFTNIFGVVPNLPELGSPSSPATPRVRRKPRAPAEQIASKVFLDGVPNFPGHYLMQLYKPELVEFKIYGPFEVVGEFFEQVSLKTINGDHTIEVSGKIVADALVLASYNDISTVSLPKDEQVLAELVQRYRHDLQQLWDNLISACRRHDPHRQAAVKLAKKIWQQHGLPPERTFKELSS